MIKIRKVAFGDIEDIIEINQRTWEISYKGFVSNEDIKERRIQIPQRILKMKSTYSNITGFVAEKDGNVVGFALGSIKTTKNECDCELSMFYVLPEYQRQGIGKMLFEAFIYEMHKLGLKKIEINTMFAGISDDKGNRQSGPSIDFYTKMGCIQTDKIEPHRLGMISVLFIKYL